MTTTSTRHTTEAPRGLDGLRTAWVEGRAEAFRQGRSLDAAEWWGLTQMANGFDPLTPNANAAAKALLEEVAR